ncbi:hypothetical protein QYE76_007125 [Lolium multiflorum]|uniref:Integrase zinc-binding domain-containing protein n=1 Tax=Lolium multiflorum TaxID=4521 RepID=A0AAD8RVZ2_LOLMU|nr:hypothetical protein QYE76_007125 [Lolium multiflorum]
MNVLATPIARNIDPAAAQAELEAQWQKLLSGGADIIRAQRELNLTLPRAAYAEEEMPPPRYRQARAAVPERYDEADSGMEKAGAYRNPLGERVGERCLPERDARHRLDRVYLSELVEAEGPPGPKCFGPRIMKEEPPVRNFQLPRDTKTYDGTTKPEDWLADYVTAVYIAGGGGTVTSGGNRRWAVRIVPSFLVGPARIWLNNLPAGSINGWIDFEEAFVSNFSSTYRRPNRPQQLALCVQRANETDRDYLTRWNSTRNSCVPRELAEHSLNVRKDARPVRQPLRRFAEDRRKIIGEEVTKLLVAGFIVEVLHTEWLANPVLVEKKKEEDPKAPKVWRMCIDYTNLNKACPKDPFPLPRIDQVIDSTAGSTNRVVSVVVVVEREEEGKAVQRPVYYLSEVLSLSKQNYPHFQKMTYGVFMAATKLKHYFEEHSMKVQCSGDWDAKDANMASYRFHVQKIAGFFEGCEFHHVPRVENEAADTLSKLGSSRQEIPPGIALAHLRAPSIKPSPELESIFVPESHVVPMDIDEGNPGTVPVNPGTARCKPEEAMPVDGMDIDVPVFLVREAPTWVEPIKEFLINGTLPVDETESRRIQRRSKAYTIINGEVYKRSVTGVLQRCVEPEEGKEMLVEIHQGECGHHASSRALVAKVFRHGFYWPTALENAEDLVRKCNGCQRFHVGARIPGVAPHYISPPSTFNVLLGSSWFDKPWFLSEGKLAVRIIPSSWGCPTNV